MTREQLFAEAMSLDPAEREVLAEDLLASLSETTREEIDAAWLAESRRRDTEFTEGRDTALPAAEVIARMRAKRPQ